LKVSSTDLGKSVLPRFLGVEVRTPPGSKGLPKKKEPVRRKGRGDKKVVSYSYQVLVLRAKTASEMQAEEDKSVF